MACVRAAPTRARGRFFQRAHAPAPPGHARRSWSFDPSPPRARLCLRVVATDQSSSTSGHCAKGSTTAKPKGAFARLLPDFDALCTFLEEEQEEAAARLASKKREAGATATAATELGHRSDAAVSASNADREPKLTRTTRRGTTDRHVHEGSGLHAHDQRLECSVARFAHATASSLAPFDDPLFHELVEVAMEAGRAGHTLFDPADAESSKTLTELRDESCVVLPQRCQLGGQVLDDRRQRHADEVKDLHGGLDGVDSCGFTTVRRLGWGRPPSVRLHDDHVQGATSARAAPTHARGSFFQRARAPGFTFSVCARAGPARPGGFFFSTRARRPHPRPGFVASVCSARALTNCNRVRGPRLRAATGPTCPTPCRSGAPATAWACSRPPQTTSAGSSSWLPRPAVSPSFPPANAPVHSPPWPNSQSKIKIWHQKFLPRLRIFNSNERHDSGKMAPSVDRPRRLAAGPHRATAHAARNSTHARTRRRHVHEMRVPRATTGRLGKWHREDLHAGQRHELPEHEEPRPPDTRPRRPIPRHTHVNARTRPSLRSSPRARAWALRTATRGRAAGNDHARRKAPGAAREQQPHGRSARSLMAAACTGQVCRRGGASPATRAHARLATRRHAQVPAPKRPGRGVHDPDAGMHA